MVTMWKSPLRLSLAMAATALMGMAATQVARPGTVNYAEGAVTVAGQSVSAKQIGQVEVEPGEVLQTATGKAEMLLTPGVLLRLGNNSAVKMVSPSLTDTRVQLLRGEAMVEASQVRNENRIDIIDGGFDTLIEKKGIYRFDADRPRVAVYDGKVKVLADDRSIEVGKGKDLALGVENKPQKFDRDQTDDLYAWSKLRSGYLAEANEATVSNVFVGGGGWVGNGWYWNPWYHSWAFVPADGYLISPFGFGFYSPSYWYSYGPVYGGGYYGYAPYRAYRPGIVGRGYTGGRGYAGRGFSPSPMMRGGGAMHGGGARTLGRGARM